MDRKIKLGVGDLVARFGKILRVSAVGKEVIELRPYFNSGTSNGLTYSIQSENFGRDNIRSLITKRELDRLLDQLTVTSPAAELDVVSVKNIQNTQSLAESLQLIKDLWLEKQNHSGYLPGGRLSLYQQALTQVSDEIAAVKGIKPQDAKQLVLGTLKKTSH